MANKANKINKQRIDETFDSLRYVDKMFNKAGGILTESKKPMSLEEKLKRSILKEAEGEETQEINIDFVDSQGEETEFNFELEDGQIVDLDTDFDLDEVGSETGEETEEEESEEGESEEFNFDDLGSEEEMESEETEEEAGMEMETGTEEGEEEELNEYNELHPSGEFGGIQSSLNPDSEMSEEELDEAVKKTLPHRAAYATRNATRGDKYVLTLFGVHTSDEYDNEEGITFAKSLEEAANKIDLLYPREQYETVNNMMYCELDEHYEYLFLCKETDIDQAHSEWLKLSGWGVDDEDEELEEAVNNLMMEADELEDTNPLESTEDLGGEDMGSEDLGAETGELDVNAEEGMDMGGEDLGEEGMDMGEDLGGSEDMAGGIGSGPSMGGSDMDMGGGEDLTGAGLEASTSISSPQDIDQLINSIVDDQTLTENKELRALGYQDLKDKDLIGNKVKMESVKSKNIKALTEAIEKRTGKKVVFKENDETIGNGFKASTKLVDKFGKPGSVEGSSATQEKPNHAAKAKVVKSVGGFTLMDLGEEDIKSSTPAPASSVKKVNADGDFKVSKLKEESVIKNKALLNLADKYVTLSESHDKLMLENYKLKKANSLLTVLPELNETTKLQIIKKFDSCKTLKEAKDLYISVTGMLKEHKGISSSVRNLNEAVIKRGSNVKYLAESLAGPSVNGITDELSNPNAEAQRRIDLLSGFGSEDDYGHGHGAY